MIAEYQRLKEKYVQASRDYRACRKKLIAELTGGCWVKLNDGRIVRTISFIKKAKQIYSRDENDKVLMVDLESITDVLGKVDYQRYAEGEQIVYRED